MPSHNTPPDWSPQCNAATSTKDREAREAQSSRGITAGSSYPAVFRAASKKKGNDTLMNLHHEGLPDDEKARRHEQGWNYLLGVLVEHHAGKRLKA